MAIGNAIGDPYFHVPEDLLSPLTWDSEGPIAAHTKDFHPTSVDGVFGLGILFWYIVPDVLRLVSVVH